MHPNKVPQSLCAVRSEAIDTSGLLQKQTTPCDSVQGVKVTPWGFEPSQESSRKSKFPKMGGAKSDAVEALSPFSGAIDR